MAIRISNEFKIILFVLLGVLVLGGSGYLIWRVNQPDTVAPDDSEATCPSNYSSPVPNNSGCFFQASWKDTQSGAEQLCMSAQRSCTECQVGRCIYVASTGTFYSACCNSSVINPPVTTFTLRYNAGAGGSITGNNNQTVNRGANGSAVTAVANTGYTFTKWSDDRMDNPRTDTNVQGNINVTAEFKTNVVNTCEGARWVEQPQGTYNHCTGIAARVENVDVDGVDINSIVVKLNGESRSRCTGASGEVCYQTSVVDGKTRIIMNLNNNSCLESGAYILSFEWKDGLGNAGCNLSSSFTIAPKGQVVVDTGDTVPQTGLLDTVFGRVSLGFGFVFLGGLVSQYSKINYLYESFQEKRRFSKELFKQKKIIKSRDKFEKRVDL